MIVAFTGHRPDKLGGYNNNSPLNKKIRHAIHDKLIELKPELVITGGALGVDTFAAVECHSLAIPYWVVSPCQNHGSNWPKVSQTIYRIICENAARHIQFDKPYSPKAMQERNEFMVDHCDILIAVWDGSPGGTANCVAYAKSPEEPKHIIYINPKELSLP